MRISDWSSDVCSSDLIAAATGAEGAGSDGAMDVYTTVGWSAVAAGVLVFIISPLVKKLMHLDTLQTQSLSGEEEVGLLAAAGVNITAETRSFPGSGRVARVLALDRKITRLNYSQQCETRMPASA